MGTSLMFVLLLIDSSRRQQWPQLADVVKPFEIADLVDQPLGPVTAQYRCNQIPRLGRHCFRAQRILLGARRIFREVLDLPAKPP